MDIKDFAGNIILSIEVDDDSVLNRFISGDDYLTLKYSLDTHIELPVGSYCEFNGSIYSLMSPEDITMKHRRNFQYVLTMYADYAKSKRYIYKDPVDNRLKFSHTATPREHLEMFAKNMRLRDGEGSGWSVGKCPDLPQILQSYNHTFCYDAVVQLAEELKLDFWFTGKVVNLGKLEVGKNDPIPLSYGGDGYGLKVDISRKNFSDTLPIETLYIQGSDKNIDFSKYGSNELHFPKSGVIAYDGYHFSDEEGFDNNSARTYKVDNDGLSISRLDKEKSTYAEDSLDCTEIYPTRDEIVGLVVEVDEEEHYFDLLFESDVDYSKCQIDGETAYIVFQDGMLAGRQFDLATNSDGEIICKKEGVFWRVELKPFEENGVIFPDKASNYVPRPEDKFRVFGVQLPEQYIYNNETMSGAEWDAFRYAVKHMYENENPQYTIGCKLDPIYAKRNWSWLKDRIALGGYVSFSDKSFQAEPILIRIIGIKEYVNKPHSPELELSNQSVSGSIIGTIKRIENQEAYNESLYREAIGFTKRRYRDAKETASMLQKALLSSFSDAVSPITINTMQAIVGDESLQYQFVKSKENPEVFTPIIEYGEITKKVTSPGGWIQHMTLGIKGVSNTHAIDEYRFWRVKELDSQVTDLDKPYYLYIKAGWNTEEAEFDLRESPIAIDAEKGVCYYFLTGILNTEIEGKRSFVPLYGFTEVLPGQITTDVIRSSDGQTYFDLVNGVIAGDIRFKSTEGGEKSVEEQFSLVDKNVQNLQDQIDGEVENHFYEGEPTTSNYPAVEWTTDIQKINHIGDTYTDISEIESDPNAGKSWRWCRCDDMTGITDYVEATDKDGVTYKLHWHPIADTDAVKALLRVYELEKKVDDAEYLKETFKKGETNISGGVVMTEMVAVGEGGDNIEAFLNGSDFAEDTENGKLILAGGIPTTSKNGSVNLEDRAKEAKIKMYEDGDFVMKGGGISVERGNIGPFYIGGPHWLATNFENTNVVLGNKSFAFIHKDDNREMLISMGNDIYSTSGYVADADGNNLFSVQTSHIRGLLLESTDTGDKTSGLIVIRRYGTGSKCAISVNNGYFAGLRPSTLRNPKTSGYSDRYTLSNLDHTIVLEEASSSTYYLNLPTSPEMGQHYEILKAKTSRTVQVKTTDSKKIFRIGNANNDTTQGISSDWGGKIELTWDGIQWLMHLVTSE